MAQRVKVYYLSFLSWFLIIAGVLLLVVTLGPILYSEAWYALKQLKFQKIVVDIPANTTESIQSTQTPFVRSDYVQDSVFARLISYKPILFEPVNKDYSIVIEKIGVNAPVVPNVSISEPKAYAEALQNGVAQAINSQDPSKEPGNVYIFAHASLDFWELGKYATTFNLLRKLEPNDPIYVFYKGDAYVYNVVNVERYPGWNTYPITRPVIEPILTLQTCDPPGTTLNRLVVTAKLRYVIEK